MLLRDGENFLELEVAEQMGGMQGAGDTHFIVRVCVTGLETVFSAETWCWVDAPTLAAFAHQLRVLEECRQGSASMESMSPGELRLEIRSTDSLGHMAAFGQVGHHCYSGTGEPRWSAVQFAIPFCPSGLPGLVQEFDAIVRGTA